MDICKYQEVNTNSELNCNNKLNWKSVLRQVFVCSGVWSSHFLYGLTVGTPTVAIPQMRKEANSTEAVTEEMASWISSGFGISGVVWLILISFLAAKIGRRKSFIIISFNSLVGFTVLYFSKNAWYILIGIVIHGASRSSMYILSPIIVTEYSSPRHRGLFATLDSASFFWGIWIANTIGTYAQWKNIAVLGILCSLYTMMAILWPESPHWLASKGRFDECTAAHRWLKGSSSRSEDELTSLIVSQTHEREESVRLKRETLLRQIRKIIKESKFYKPFLISFLVTFLFDFSGKAVNIMYPLFVLNNITNSIDAAYTGMLILDGLTFFCAYIGCGLANGVKRRTLLFTASSISILFMLMISLHLYLIKLGIVSYNAILSLVLLSGYSLAISCGPMILTTAIISELLPLKYRSLMYLIVSLMGMSTITFLLKMSLQIFKNLGMHGTFLLVYALPSIFILSLLYKYLPETKDKTLQEIEEYYKDN